MSAAFDCVEHSILLCHLQVGSALHASWSTGLRRFWQTAHNRSPTTVSCPSRRQFCVQCPRFGNRSAAVCYSTLPNCLKSSRVMGWTFVSMMTTPSCIFWWHICSRRALDACLVDVKAWLRASRLRLNATKTQVMWLGSWQQLAKMDTDEVSLLASRVHVLDAEWNLSVIFDNQLSTSVQVSAVCRTGYYQLRQLCLLVRCMSEDAAKILIQAFIHRRRQLVWHGAALFLPSIPLPSPSSLPLPFLPFPPLPPLSLPLEVGPLKSS